MKNMNTLRRNRLLAPATAVVLGLAACSGSGEDITPIVSASPSPATASASPERTGSEESLAPSGPRFDFTFDSLLDPRIDMAKGGSNVIYVHSSPYESSRDGRYLDGQVAEAACAEPNGRTIKSDPKLGEAPKESDDWVGLVTVGNQISYYASMTYGKLPDGAFEKLPPC